MDAKWVPMMISFGALCTAYSAWHHHEPVGVVFSGLVGGVALYTTLHHWN